MARLHKGRVDPVREDVSAPQAGYGFVKSAQVRHAAPQHDDIRIEDVDHACEGTGQALLVAQESGQARTVARLAAGYDRLRRRLASPVTLR